MPQRPFLVFAPNRVPENRNEVRFLGKRSRRHQTNRFARRANLCGICRTDLLGLPKIAGQRPRFLGKRRNRRQCKEFAHSADSCKTRRAPLQGSRKSQRSEIFGKEELPASAQTACALRELLRNSPSPYKGSRKSQGNARDFWERGGTDANAKSLRAAQTLAKRVAPLYRAPENRNEVRFLGKRSRRHQSNRFARRANLCGICRTATWLRGQDSNLRPSGYEPDELPNCSTPR